MMLESKAFRNTDLSVSVRRHSLALALQDRPKGRLKAVQKKIMIRDHVTVFRSRTVGIIFCTFTSSYKVEVVKLMCLESKYSTM